MKRSIVKTAKTKDEAIKEALKEINKSIDSINSMFYILYRKNKVTSYKFKDWKFLNVVGNKK